MGSFLSSSSNLYWLQSSRTRGGKFCESFSTDVGVWMQKDTDRVLVVLLTDGLVHCSVLVRDEDVYLRKDVIDHLFNLLSRHSLGILDSFGDIRA